MKKLIAFQRIKYYILIYHNFMLNKYKSSQRPFKNMPE